MGSCSAAAVCRAVSTTVSCVRRRREGSLLPSLYILARVGGMKGHNIVCVDMHVAYHFS